MDQVVLFLLCPTYQPIPSVASVQLLHCTKNRTPCQRPCRRCLDILSIVNTYLEKRARATLAPPLTAMQSYEARPDFSYIDEKLTRAVSALHKEYAMSSLLVHTEDGGMVAHLKEKLHLKAKMEYTYE